MSSKETRVSVSLGTRVLQVGTLWTGVRKGQERATFQYHESWLNHSGRFALEPALQLTGGSFYAQPDTGLFGALGDSAPDRWGRILARRAETHRARAAGRTPRTLFETDYLLAVSDFARQGALRFSVPEYPTEYLAPAGTHDIPPLVNLPALLSAAQHVAEDRETAEDLKLLLAPGSSVGGARPKAVVLDTDNSLAIAKFPAGTDDHNVVVWEAVAMELAKNAGICVSDFRLEYVGQKPVLVLKRFDRSAEHRVPYLSAMSMLGAWEGEQHSYLELVGALEQHGATPAKDMSELWRRVVFSILISNTDDHLRNHGFLYKRNRGWTLSPAFDLNPTPIQTRARQLSTCIDYDNADADLTLARSVARYFRLSQDQAESIISEVSGSVHQWQRVARSYGLGTSECMYMAPAFLNSSA